MYLTAALDITNKMQKLSSSKKYYGVSELSLSINSTEIWALKQEQISMIPFLIVYY